ncbi:MAG TPA: phosphatase PAP2 family protein [Chitinophagaceae bacterium]|nr:phosphatase PAP2 family protein [Chitinophagaceae bacterium]
MKKLFAAVCALTLFYSCSKDLTEQNRLFPQLQPKSQDLNGGTWKTLLLAAPDEIAVPAPAAVNSPGYLSELLEIKDWQRKLTSRDRESIRYWSAGGVLRWNEIMRELVAKYNLPPYQNPDGTYPVPNAANPFAYPAFPFANPPYAARAYAYVSAAQYDALVAAWHYKKLYNRPSPYTTDNTIERLVHTGDLPSYPSEDAVIAGVSVELMKLLFPAEQAFIQEKAHEYKLARIKSGANTRSDIEAGEALGRQVAAKFTARARTDRAGAAAGSPAIWKDMETATAAKGETPWLSLEVPKRPPMLMAFGKVKSFLMDSMMIVNGRPAPPPSTTSEQFKKELAEVRYYSDNPTRERIRIVHFWADGVGTYTPPGHWNALAVDEFIKQGWSEIRWARNMALLNLSMMDAAICCWDAKFAYFNPRPAQMDPKIKTVTGTPNFPSFTSGHSTFSGAAATILGHILPGQAARFLSMAEEASMSRLYGGIHYRSDCEVGLQMGKNIGQVAIEHARTDGAE